jgi:hypothetical protein
MISRVQGFIQRKLLPKSDGKINEFVLIIFIFLLNLFLVLPKLQPQMLEINPDDGAKYIESGRLLLEWGLRNLAWAPLVAFIYAPIHLIVGNSPNWFMLEVWIGNYILFGMLWLSFYALARQLDKYISKYVIIGLLFVSTIFFPILENQSDALFIPLSVLALFFLIRFSETHKLKNVWMSSLFVGLGILTRFESILLIATLIVFVLILGRRHYKWVRLLLASLIPILIIMSLFFSTNLLTFGHLNIGTGSKSYESFQMNNAFLPGSENAQAFARGEDIFSTDEENNNSIFKAILHNPLATGERILANVLILPDLFLNFFGKLQGPIFAIFTIAGLLYLIKKKETATWLLLLIWPLHSLVSLLFLTRHIIPQMSYMFFMLSGIGITYLLRKKTSKIYWLVLLFMAVCLVGFSIIGHKPAFLAAGLLLTVVSVAGPLDRIGDTAKFRVMPAFLLLVGMFAFGYGFSFPSNVVGLSQDEIGAQQLQSEFPANSNILTSYHTVAIAGKATSFTLPSTVKTTEQFLEFLSEKDLDGIYVDSKIAYPSDVVLKTLDAYPDKFELVYLSTDNNIELYRIIK